jgi:acetyl esterase/lipase
MTDMQNVAEALRKPLKRFPTVALDRRPILALARLATRFSKTAPTEGVAIEDLSGGGVHLRIYQPLTNSSGAGMLWMHGGGLIAGDPKMDDALIGPVVAELGITVVSVGYRRAPEHPFPAPLDDSMAAWRWMLASATLLGVDPDRIAIGGESAGGSLAAAAAQRIHDDGGTQPAAVWLMCPMLDDRTACRRSPVQRSCRPARSRPGEPI